MRLDVELDPNHAKKLEYLSHQTHTVASDVLIQALGF